MTNYDILPCITRINTVLQHPIKTTDELLNALHMSTHTNRDYDNITPN